MNTGQERFQGFFSNQPSYKLFCSYLVHALNNKGSHQHTDHIVGDKSYSEILKSPVGKKIAWQLLHSSSIPWWRHQMETFSALLAICAGNSPVSGEFPAQRPVTQSFDVFFDLCLIKRLSKTLVRLVIWDAIAPIMTSLQCKKKF